MLQEAFRLIDSEKNDILKIEWNTVSKQIIMKTFLRSLQYIYLLYFSYFFLYKFYCNKNTISIVSFNLSEKYYSPVNSINDLIYLIFHFCYLEHVWWRLLQKLVLLRACLMKVITEIHQKRTYNLEFESAVVKYNKTLIDLIFGNFYCPLCTNYFSRRCLGK